MSKQRSAAQLNSDERMDIIQGVRSVAGNDFDVRVMIGMKAKEHDVHEDAIRLVVMSAAMIYKEHQARLPLVGPKGSEQ